VNRPKSVGTMAKVGTLRNLGSALTIKRRIFFRGVSFGMHTHTISCHLINPMGTKLLSAVIPGVMGNPRIGDQEVL
jgi:hypothetical protein